MKTLVLLALLLVACQPVPPMTPSLAEEATYKTLTGDSLGTSFAISEHYLLTAGHMCDGVKKVALEGTNHVRFAADVVDYELDYDTNADICLLHTDRKLPQSVSFALQMPSAGDEVWYVGYPLGDFTKGVGVYVGDTDEAHNNDFTSSAPCDHGASGSAMFSASGVYGILVRLQVFEAPPSMLDELLGRDKGLDIRPGPEGCVVTPLEQIGTFLKKNGLSL